MGLSFLQHVIIIPLSSKKDKPLPWDSEGRFLGSKYEVIIGAMVVGS